MYKIFHLHGLDLCNSRRSPRMGKLVKSNKKNYRSFMHKKAGAKVLSVVSCYNVVIVGVASQPLPVSECRAFRCEVALDSL